MVGPSGSGKSTLLNIVGLLISPTSGRYLLDGIDTGRARPRELARAESLAPGLRLPGLPPPAPSERSGEHVAGRPLPRSVRQRTAYPRGAAAGPGRPRPPPRARARPRFPAEKRQRAAIARALVAGPSLLLADEPTGNLDTASAASVLDLFADLNQDGTTIVMITHDARCRGPGDPLPADRRRTDPAHDPHTRPAPHPGDGGTGRRLLAARPADAHAARGGTRPRRPGRHGESRRDGRCAGRDELRPGLGAAGDRAAVRGAGAAGCDSAAGRGAEHRRDCRTSWPRER